MLFLAIPLHNLGRRPLRSSLTALGVAIAVGSFVALVGLSRGVERAWVQSVVERGTHIGAVRKGAVEILTTSLDQAIANDLERIEGVEEASPELVDLATLDQGHTILVTGWPLGSFLWRTLPLRDGALPDARDPSGVVMGQVLAHTLGVEPGGTVRLRGRDFAVVGISRQTSTLNNNTLFTPLDTLQALLDRPGRATLFNLRVTEPGEPTRVAAVLARLRAAFPDLSFVEVREIADDNQALRLLRATAWGVSVVALVMGLVVVLNTVLMSVTERTREIGVLSAVGWQPGRILAMIVLESLVLAAAGAAIGLGLGIGGLHWLAGLPPLRGFIEPATTLRTILEVIASALLLGVLGSMGAAWRAIRLRPLDALRHE